MLRAFIPVAFASVIAGFTACGDSRPTERKIVGAWSWTYIEGKGRMVFTADRKVKEGFPPEEDPGRPLREEDFTYLDSGTWRLEGDVLVTETDNSPWIALSDRLSHDISEEVRPKRPKLERKTECQQIVKIDSEKM